MYLRRLLIAAILVLVSAGAVRADQGLIVHENLTARLVAENAVTRPGEVVTVALYQTMSPGWHTYWRNPGDSGQPPSLDWDAPAGVQVMPQEWPAPERIPYGPMVNFGYSNEAVMLYDVAVPTDWPSGQPLTLRAEAEILVCEDVCIPVNGLLSVDMPTGPETAKAQGQAALFASARAAQPLTSPWQVTASAGNGLLTLALDGPRSDFISVDRAFIFADTWGVLDHVGDQRFVIGNDGLHVTAPLGDASMGDMLSGVLTLHLKDGPSRSFVFSDVPVGAPAPGADDPMPSLTLLILLALAGGVLLNLMPCVFPVLAVKALALARHADAPLRQRLALGGAYTAGVVISFLGLAAVLIALRAGGAAIGWGFQLQEPLVVAALAYVATAVGLNLSGVFEIGSGLSRLGGNLKIGDGHSGAFLTGVLAAVVAAPCTAPFMATAIGGALLLPTPAALAVFGALGLGLALPYLAVSGTPALVRLMPKPGPWMIRFKQLLAFPMYATTAWLLWVLSRQAGADAAFLAMLGLIGIALAAWMWTGPGGNGGLRLMRVAIAVLPLAGAVGALGWIASMDGSPAATAADAQSAEPFNATRLQELTRTGQPVFVNMTADWCITCKVNERVALSGPAFTDLLARHGIAYMQGDWTNRDPEITRFLENFGRAGVPLYVLFPGGGGEPRVLPQVLTPGALGDVLSSIASGNA